MTGRTTTGRRVFAADVHIHPRDPSRAERFFEWLDSERDRAEVVYLLGDLFDLWVGSRQARHPDYRDLVDRLAERVRDGMRIEFVHGNRDFQIGRAFERRTGIRVHQDPMPADFGEGDILLTHGDLLCASDLAYQRTRRVLRSAPVRLLGEVLPLRLVFGIGGILRRYSDRAVERKSTRVLEPPRDAVVAHVEHGRRVIVCGHLHHAHRRTYEQDGQTIELICLGAWENGSGSYVSYEEGRFRLHVLDGERWVEIESECGAR